MNRANFIGAPHFFNLSQACAMIAAAFGSHVYLVGSAITRRDYRDVDVRLILPDESFDRMFPGISTGWYLDARWSLMCSSISLWLSHHTSLPVDFQVQRQTEANAENVRAPRHPLGVFLCCEDEARATALKDQR